MLAYAILVSLLLGLLAATHLKDLVHIMSIISQASKGAISWPEAFKEIQAYLTKLSPARVAVVEDNLKQAASNAVAAADTALGVIIGDVTAAASVAISVGFAQAGIIGVAATPSTLATLQSITAAAKAAMDEEAVKIEASLAPVPVTNLPS